MAPKVSKPDGLLTWAPCKHLGRVVIGNYVECLARCHENPEELEDAEEDLFCEHLSQQLLGKVRACIKCGVRL